MVVVTITTLTLWANGNMQPLGVSVEQLRRQTNKPAIKATTKLNPQTGIISNAQIRFSAENWGKEMAHYLRSIKKMRDGSCYIRTSLYFADTSDCPVSFSYSSPHRSPCTIRSGAALLYDMIYRLFLYDINLRATLTMILSIRGVTIPIYLVSSITDSIRRHVVLFKPVPIPTSDPKSEFLCQSSISCKEPADSP